ncbi:39S ribosomal protein L32, mitochondrial [Anthophora plagiata]
MASSVFNRLYRAFKTFDQVIDTILGRNLPLGSLYAIECNAINQVQPKNVPARSLKDILNDAILWAAPKKRRTIERRLCRRFGVPDRHWKPPVPKTNLMMCRKCGHDYEGGTLCGYCYEIVKKETQEMQEVIQSSLGLDPVEKDVIVLYEGEKEHLREDFWKNQRIVEMPKKRPEWFHQNLLQPTTEESTDSKSEKPDGITGIIKND